MKKNKQNSKNLSQQKRTRKNSKAKKPNIVLRIMGRVFKIVLTIVLIIGFIGILALAYFFFTTAEVTDQNYWTSKQTTKIMDRNNELIQIHGKNIKYVTLDEVSPYYIDGLLATEDSNFYHHTGVDFRGMIRAFLQTIFTDSDSGGSTITMQLAKNLYLSGTQKMDEEGSPVYTEEGYPIMEYPFSSSIGYKLQQMVYAWKIESKYSKEEILENYINSLGFDGPVGIEKASQTYFGVESKYLSLSQAATLAGMTQSPHNYNPYRDIDAATKRRDIVLLNMLNDDFITRAEYDEAKKENIADTLVEESDVVDEEYEIIKPYLDVVTMELREDFGEDFDINQADATIYTSLDYELQEETYHQINNDYGNIRYESDVLQAGSASLDTSTGEILSIGGGREGVDTVEQNYGAFYLRQPGSTSKPIVDYGPALEYLGWSTYHQMVDKPVNYTGGPAVANAYSGFYGQMSIQEALSRSTNTIALQTFQQVAQSVGIDKIEEFMNNLGISDLGDDKDGLNESYSIGGWDSGTTPLELAGAYAAFGNGGEYNEPHAVRRIEFSKTSPYYEEYGGSYEPEYVKNTAMSTATAYMITKMLDPNLPTALTYDMYVPALGEQGIKTGTSNWAENIYGVPEGSPRDKWVAGYNADITTVIWTGYSGEYESQGIYFDSYGLWSYDIYKGIMEYAANSDKEYLHDGSILKDSNVYSKQINGNTYYFKKGTSEYEEQESKEKETQQQQELEKEQQQELEKEQQDQSSSGTKTPNTFTPDQKEDNTTNQGESGQSGNQSSNNGTNDNSPVLFA